MNSVQLIALMTAGLFLFQVIYFTSRNKLHDQQAFLWLLFGIGGIIVAALLPQFNNLATALGIAYMPTFVFMLAFFVVLNLLMYQTTVISSLQKKTNILIQELSFHRKEIEELKEKAEGKQP